MLRRRTVVTLTVVNVLVCTLLLTAVPGSRDPAGPRPAAAPVLPRSLPLPEGPLSKLRTALGGREDRVRLDALERLLDQPSVELRGALAQASRSEDPLERRLARGALARMGDLDAARDLREETGSVDPWVGVQAAEVMFRAGLADAPERWNLAVARLSERDRRVARVRLERLLARQPAPR